MYARNTIDNTAENVGYVAARGGSRKTSVGLKNVVHRGFEEMSVGSIYYNKTLMQLSNKLVGLYLARDREMQEGKTKFIRPRSPLPCRIVLHDSYRTK